MKRNQMEESKFDPDMTIHTPIELKALIKFMRHILFLKMFMMIFLSPKISTQKGRFEWPCF